MSFRAFSVFFSFSLATSSLAQVGTIEKVIEAVINGTEPEYVTELMKQLAEELQTLVPKDLDYNPRKKLFCFQSMLEVTSATLEQAMKAAESATAELLNSKKKAAQAGTTSDWFKAVDAAFQASPYPYYAKSFTDESLDKECWYDAWQAARKALEAEREAQIAARKALKNWAPHPKLTSIAFQAAQWGALNWLLKNIKDILPKTYEKISRAYYANNNPFVSKASSNALYERHFKGLSENALVFLAPILVYLFPRNRTEEHREYYPGFVGYQPSLEEIAQSAGLWFDLPFPDHYPMY